MPNEADVADDYTEREMNAAMKPRSQPVAVVWEQHEQIHHTVLLNTTTRKAKEALEVNTGINLLDSRWAVAHFVDERSVDVVTSGHPSLRDQAKQTLLDFDPNEPPLTIKEVHDLVVAASS